MLKLFKNFGRVQVTERLQLYFIKELIVMKNNLFLIRYFCFIFVFILLISVPSNSAEISGVKFNTEYIHKDKKLTLRGYSVLNYMYVIKAYAGAFYLEEKNPISESLGKNARILELEYFQNIKAVDFSFATAEMIKKNISSEEFIKMEERVKKFNSLYRDVKPGDRYRVLYIHGEGTFLYYNGVLLGTVGGEDFAFGFFSIWLGKNPIDKKFKAELLGE